MTHVYGTLYGAAVNTILLGARHAATVRAGLAKDLAAAAADRAQYALAHSLGMADIRNEGQRAMLAGRIAGRVLQRALAATAEVRDDAHLADVADVVDEALPALKHRKDRVGAERTLRQFIVSPLDADPLFGAALHTLMVCLRRTGQDQVTAYARLAAEVLRDVSASDPTGVLDQDGLYAAWLDVIGPHFLALARDAVDTRTAVAADTVKQDLAQRKDVTTWAGTTRPTLNRWINDRNG